MSLHAIRPPRPSPQADTEKSAARTGWTTTTSMTTSHNLLTDARWAYSILSPDRRGARCGSSKTHPPPIGARPSFERPPGAPRGLLMAVPKWASTGLGWGGGRCPGCGRVAAPWAWEGQQLSTPKLPPRRHTALPASLFLLLQGCAGARPGASARARLATFERVLPPPQGLWAGAGAPEGVHAGGRWGPMARRRRRFFAFFLFSRFFTCFHGNSAYLRPCYHALRQPVGAADRAMMHN